MIKTYKYKSRLTAIIVTILIAILTYVATMQPEVLATYLPSGYEGYAAIIIVIAAAIINQYTEEKRVNVAEQIIIEQQSSILGKPSKGGVILNDEYTLPIEGEEDGT